VDALVQARMGATSDAAAELDALRREADLLSMAVDAAWLELDRAGVLAISDRPAAIAGYKEAGARGSAMGATTLVRLADYGLRGLGVRAWRPSGRAGEDVGAAGLTARELEVARLIAGGATNPEIAARLFLARKTVERHVSNVFLKVGVRNRTELATRLRDESIGGALRELPDDALPATDLRSGRFGGGSAARE
jgi:DNA-binding CsgD family transcriptional regulator